MRLSFIEKYYYEEVSWIGKEKSKLLKSKLRGNSKLNIFLFW